MLNNYQIILLLSIPLSYILGKIINKIVFAGKLEGSILNFPLFVLEMTLFGIAVGFVLFNTNRFIQSVSFIAAGIVSGLFSPTKSKKHK
ncbi:MAG TPA: hypothetical protein VHY08_01365 [Bacillota bacterium]|nr:hypothetical protein [Bacillota bacterium]